jgi:hypothetical protein
MYIMKTYPLKCLKVYIANQIRVISKTNTFIPSSSYNYEGKATMILHSNFTVQFQYIYPNFKGYSTHILFITLYSTALQYLRSCCLNIKGVASGMHLIQICTSLLLLETLKPNYYVSRNHRLTG